ncbi:hypothetical protein [Paludisphaera soli]|uniref:hypothetical protein n=1 Tax=Paludisphaera soli TaxID=2712865 RepID=UPI0013EC2350|nr:hypothetical protein [Paludisphaera soli]
MSSATAMKAKRWAAYRRMADGSARLLGVVEADGEKAAIRAAMAEHGLAWRAVAVRIAGDGEPAGSIVVGRPASPRPWDGTELVRHELSAMFPDMTPDVYGKLVESVREHGAMKPVVLHEEAVLDGWHRYRAYREVGVPFDVEDWSGEYGSALAFVLAENEVRRDLTPSQRAALAVEVKKRLGEEYRERSIANLKYSGEEAKDRVTKIGNSMANAQAEAAEALGVSKGYVHDAERIEETSPQTFEAVKRGEKTIPQAKRELGLDRPKPKAEPEPEPAPEPKAPPRTVVNGEAREDAAVERLRAKGVIPADALVTVEDPGEDATDLEAIKEEHAERAAKADELPDDEWLARLPLTSKLTGLSLDRFKRDALYYRRFEAMRRKLVDFHGRAVKEVFKGTAFRGFVAFSVARLLKVEHPDRWHPCPAVDKGGCDGSGTVPMLGDCPMCRGRGYLAR